MSNNDTIAASFAVAGKTVDADQRSYVPRWR